MSRARRTVIGVVAVLAMVGAACSTAPDADTAQGDGTRVGDEDRKKARSGGKSKPGSGQDKRRGKKGSAAGERAPGLGSTGDQPSAPPPDPGTQPSGSFASNGPPSPVDPSLARRSASVDDSSNDAQKQGVTPPYAELLGVGIQGLGETFEMRLTFGGNVPAKTEDENTVMVIGFGISAGGNDTYGFTAQASQDGWKAYAGAKHKARKFPGRFLVEGDTIVMRVPWRFIDGPREFRFQATTTWFKSIANTTHYAFDMAPQERSAQFPE